MFTAASSLATSFGKAAAVKKATADGLLWDELLERGLRAAGQTRASACDQKKSEPRKVWVACELKSRTNAPNAWIADHLFMGLPQSVSVHVGKFRSARKRPSKENEAFIKRFTK